MRPGWRLGLAMLLCASLGAEADEGMWLAHEFPSEQVKRAYGWSPQRDWLEHVQRSSVRLAQGCSGSFVSPRGLVMTNHHCIRKCLVDLSKPGRDLLQTGFFAQAEQAEPRCPGLELNQLLEVTDVTARVQQAIAGRQSASLTSALRAELAQIEGACASEVSTRCEVVSLFHGGRYELYRYRRLQDVRLVFAPEFELATFGGYADNFSFPRYAVDAAFLRVYEAQTFFDSSAHHFRLAATPAREGDLVFVAGHPGGTERAQTGSQLEFQRDVALPWTLGNLWQLRGHLLEFQSGSAERARIVKSRLRAVENSLKALEGRRRALADPAFFRKKLEEDTAFKKRVAEDPARSDLLKGWDEIDKGMSAWRRSFAEHRMLEGPEAFNSELFGHARTLVRAAEELPKPSAQRLREFGDAALPQVEQGLFSPQPTQPLLEELTLTVSLGRMRDLGAVDEGFVRAVLGPGTPEEVARFLVRKTKLGDPRERERLYRGGRAAVEASKDPLILLARQVDEAARAARKKHEELVEGPLRRGGELLAQARLAVLGTSGYPDATFTFRVSYGQVRGWEEGGQRLPALTTFAGLFARQTGKAPLALPASVMRARTTLDPLTPLNVCTTNDIIGGNSGSPLLNRDAEVVGLVFDGNLASLGGRYGYEGDANRTVAVQSVALLELIDKAYSARRLKAELAHGSEETR